MNIVIHNETLRPLVKEQYTTEDIQAITDLLNHHKSLEFPAIDGRGLFKAALSPVEESSETNYTGYDNVWVRDNIHISFAHYVINKPEVAVSNLRDISSFWLKYQHRWNDCIAGTANTDNVMERPHIRFNGTLLEENEQTWSHAQNDAIGYFNWLYCKLAREGKLEAELDILVLIALYQNKIQFWNDDDNGHWEEARKIEASSIGTATAGFRELNALLEENAALLESFNAKYSAKVAELSLTLEFATGKDFVQYLFNKGHEALFSILPFECRTEGLVRETDGALLFLVYPLQIVSGQIAQKIVDDVVEHLAGDYGVRRYRGDSYWMADYKTIFSEENRTADFSEDIGARDRHFKYGTEAQWCIFDSIISCCYGLQVQKAQSAEFAADAYQKQVHFFNRAVGQVTGEDCHYGPWHCPESYYIENGKYVVNDVCPLLWTQANLLNALTMMNNTVTYIENLPTLQSFVLPTHYNVTLVPGLNSSLFYGQVSISLTVSETTDTLVANAKDLVISDASVVAFRVEPEGLTAVNGWPKDPATHRALQKATQITYEGEVVKFVFEHSIPATSNIILHAGFQGRVANEAKGLYSNGESLETLFESGNASLVFPCWDQKSYKATFDLTLHIPQDLSATFITDVLEDKTVQYKTKNLRSVKFAQLEKLIKQRYKKNELKEIMNLLKSKNTLTLNPIPNTGLYMSSSNCILDKSLPDYTGHENVWIRDNVYIAFSHYMTNKYSSAVATLKDIEKFWLKYKNRWHNCITGAADPFNVMERPHIRFNGFLLEENDQTWSHAENDSIGYFNWLYCKFAREGLIAPETEMLVLISLFQNAVEYWHEADSGHWEESRKIEASSVGTATAGFRELKLLLEENVEISSAFEASYQSKLAELGQKSEYASGLDLVKALFEKGHDSLFTILPFECRTEGQIRKIDGALIFLIYPLQIVEGEMALKILDEVNNNLVGEYGVRRYIGDSYWMADYKTLFKEQSRTVDFSEVIGIRDRFFKKGQEAQWCNFDSLISCCYGLQVLQASSYETVNAAMEKQTHFFNRNLGQITGDECTFGPWLCPGSYYIERGKYVHDDVCNLLWTQANLITASVMLEKCIEKANSIKNALPTGVNPTHYALNIIPDLTVGKFTGHASIRVTPGGLGLVGSWKKDPVTHRATQSASKITINNAQEIVTFHFDSEIPATAQIILHTEFQGNHNDQLTGFYKVPYEDEEGHEKFTAVTQFEPGECRSCFPCWDEPSLKATFEVALYIPKNLTAISNMPIKEEAEISLNGKDLKVVKFKDTPVMSTFLVAFCVGEFDYLEATISDIPCRIYTPRQMKDHAKFALEVTSQLFAFFAKYFGIEYPLPKLDLVCVPDLSAEAMENWGLIVFRESVLLPDDSTSKTLKNITATIAHELAHQWFGNLVTMDWWDDLWLNEGFANFIGTLAVETLFPKWNVFTDFISNEYNRALVLDSISSSHPVHASVCSTKDIDDVFDGISFNKGAAIIRMIHAYVGPTTFAAGINKYLVTYKHGNATRNQLWQCLSEVSGKDITQLVDNWVREAGYPILSLKENYHNETNTLELEITQTRFLQSAAYKDKTIWNIPISVITDKGEVEERFLLTEKTGKITIPYVKGPDSFWKLNIRASGLYRVDYTLDQLQNIGNALKKNLNTFAPEDRVSLLLDINALSQARLVPDVSVLELLKGYENEDNHAVLEEISSLLAIVRNRWYNNSVVTNGINSIARRLFSGKVALVGYEEAENECHIKALARNTIIKGAAEAGDENVLNELVSRFQSYKNDEYDVIDEHLCSLMFKVALARSKDPKSDFLFLFKIYSDEDSDPEEQDAVLESIGAINDPELLKKLLTEFLFNPDLIKQQDITTILYSIAMYSPFAEEAVKILSHWLLSNWTEININVPQNMIGNVIRACLFKNHNAQFIEYLEKWLAGDDCKSEEQKALRLKYLLNSRKSFDQVLANLQIITNWCSKDFAAIEQWFTKHGYIL
ncbi:hypothetical protein HDV01_000764 [Terramyces sp. JEL0728]|nr:hypothetical protein HDV01_000764 [Terramyces sp. JEL0728]